MTPRPDFLMHVPLNPSTMNLRPPPNTINDAPKVNRFARAPNGNQGPLHDDGYAVSGIIVNKLVSFLSSVLTYLSIRSSDSLTKLGTKNHRFFFLKLSLFINS